MGAAIILPIITALMDMPITIHTCITVRLASTPIGTVTITGTAFTTRIARATS